MKREVQLYISNNRVDLFKDETISLTDSIKNVRDIAKVFTTFTKSFTLPASKNNNKLFQHYYNFDIINGSSSHEDKLEMWLNVFNMNLEDFKKQINYGS